jgi:hypothetical protein
VFRHENKCILISLFPTFLLDQKSSKKIKAVEVILEIHNIFGRPTQTPHSFKNGGSDIYASYCLLTFLKLLVKQGSLFALRCWDFYELPQRPLAPRLRVSQRNCRCTVPHFVFFARNFFVNSVVSKMFDVQKALA